MKITYDDINSFEIAHIFEYYDFPLFFISSSSNKYYLNYYVDELDSGEHKWIFSEITNMERLNLLNQRISVITILNKLKDSLRLNYLFIDPTKDSTDILKIDRITETNFDQESFPLEDYWVEYDHHLQKELKKSTEIELDASKFKIVLKDAANSHDIALDFFVGILQQFKTAFNDIASDIYERTTGVSNGANIGLKLDSLQPSSFGVYLKSEDDLFGTNKKVLGHFFEVIDMIENQNAEDIIEFIDQEDYSLSTLKSINDLLKEIKNNKYSISFKSKAETDQSAIEVGFDRSSYSKVDVINNKLLDVTLEREEIDVVGVLRTINTSTNYFTIDSPEQDFKGRMSKELFNKVKNDLNKFTVPYGINAKLIKETRTELANKTSRVKFVLESYRQTDEKLVEKIIEEDKS
ncbi:hypothetical protein PJK55_06005 [Exiguobacterium sp. MMG028]|uniref:hypothetical protein n=1 Tax=Exiguobacterium sp. MMG028 TaxID=3021979 RepID=UPI0022FE4A78|nr:hypothetical protein [Exiguobacterium sp. MMG028]MDA5560284.1 hypothetical protein [Exiguobacterium sp. MMG028]